MNNIVTKLIHVFQQKRFTLQQAYEVIPEYNKESIRARVYENLGELFERISRGVYEVTLNDITAIVIEDDARDLSILANESVDAIIADYPWVNPKAHKGGNRGFANDYTGFIYASFDFEEKARVLKKGCFLIEFLPLESESNWKELARIKQLAENAGLFYYAKVPYYENRIRNTGRTSKAGGDLLFFTKGKARALRPDMKKRKQTGDENFCMSGTSAMLPISFQAPLPAKKELRHQSMKSIHLIEEILTYITKEEEIVLDQYAGSFATTYACMKQNRFAIAIEKNKQFVDNAYVWLSQAASVLNVDSDNNLQMRLF
ncbi:MAG: site-specific DNA-methyltransferase [Streptococcaceae bacterium]|nr:site-specific DNA-methyltransferase [Streptococcaceae bacterium]